MKCPKCGYRMNEYKGSSKCSTIHRTDGAATAASISGWECIMCGKWVEAEVVVTCPIPEKNLNYVNQKSGAIKGMTSKKVSEMLIAKVRVHYDAIVQLRIERVSYPNIKKKLDLDVSPTTIERAIQKINKEKGITFFDLYKNVRSPRGHVHVN